MARKTRKRKRNTKRTALDVRRVEEKVTSLTHQKENRKKALRRRDLGEAGVEGAAGAGILMSRPTVYSSRISDGSEILTIVLHRVHGRKEKIKRVGLYQGAVSYLPAIVVLFITTEKK